MVHFKGVVKIWHFVLEHIFNFFAFTHQLHRDSHPDFIFYFIVLHKLENSVIDVLKISHEFSISNFFLTKKCWTFFEKKNQNLFSLSLQNVNMKLNMGISTSAIYEWNSELIIHIKL